MFIIGASDTTEIVGGIVTICVLFFAFGGGDTITDWIRAWRKGSNKKTHKLPKQKFCDNCGNACPPNAKHCRSCGEKL